MNIEKKKPIEPTFCYPLFLLSSNIERRMQYMILYASLSNIYLDAGIKR